MVSNITVTVFAFALKQSKVDDMIEKARKIYKNGNKSFHFFDVLYPSTVSPVIDSPNKSGKIVQRSMDMNITLRVERS